MSHTATQSQPATSAEKLKLTLTDLQRIHIYSTLQKINSFEAKITEASSDPPHHKHQCAVPYYRVSYLSMCYMEINWIY